MSDWIGAEHLRLLLDSNATGPPLQAPKNSACDPRLSEHCCGRLASMLRDAHIHLRRHPRVCVTGDLAPLRERRARRGPDIPRSGGISTHFFAADTPAAARTVFPYYHEYLQPKTPGGRGFMVDRAGFEAGTQPGQAHLIGSSDELVNKILQVNDQLGIDRFFGQIDWGGLPRELVEDSITRLATEIAPAVRRETSSLAA